MWINLRFKESEDNNAIDVEEATEEVEVEVIISEAKTGVDDVVKVVELKIEVGDVVVVDVESVLCVVLTFVTERKK